MPQAEILSKEDRGCFELPLKQRPIGKPGHEREYVTELGENIRKFTELMRLPKRSINNSMREVLGNISKLHAYGQEQYNTLKKKQS